MPFLKLSWEDNSPADSIAGELFFQHGRDERQGARISPRVREGFDFTTTKGDIRDFKSRDLKTLSKRVSRVKRDPTEIRALPRPIVSAGPLYCSREKRLAYIARETAKRKRRPPLFPVLQYQFFNRQPEA